MGARGANEGHGRAAHAKRRSSAARGRRRQSVLGRTVSALGASGPQQRALRSGTTHSTSLAWRQVRVTSGHVKLPDHGGASVGRQRRLGCVCAGASRMEREFPLHRDGDQLHRGRSVAIIRSGGSGATIQVIQDLHGGSFFHSPCSHPSVETYERLLLITRAENIQLASAERADRLSGTPILPLGSLLEDTSLSLPETGDARPPRPSPGCGASSSKSESELRGPQCY